MASLIVTGTAKDALELLDIVIENDAATPAVLRGVLSEKGIVLATDRTKLEGALVHEKSQGLLSRQSHNASELRNTLFDPVFSATRGIAQYLKSIYKPNYQSLGAWGLPVLSSGKINYPPNVMDRMKIFNDLHEYYVSLPSEENKLTVYVTTNEINMAALKGKADRAAEQNALFERTAAEAEAETEERDKLLNPVLGHLQDIGDNLMKLYAGSPRKVGLWGFHVDESTAKPKDRTTTLKLGEKITLKGVQIGSVLTNIGETELHIYKGSTTTGDPIILHPGEKVGIAKGFSTITVSNPNLLKSGKFTSVTTSS